MPSVTILVPCFNEAGAIEAKLRNCWALDTSGLDVETLVVDDHSTDDTLARARALGAQTVQNRRPPGKWQAVAAGAEQARGEILCITDADVLVGRRSLRRAVQPFRDPRVGAVCGLRQMVRRRADGSLAHCDGIYDAVRKSMILFYSLLDSSPALCGPMMLMRRELLGRIDAGRLRADDVDVPVQVRRLGLKAKVCAGARFAELELPREARQAQAMRRAIGLAQSYWRHRAALFDPRLGAFGLVAYPMEFAFYFLSPWLALAGCAAAAIAAVSGSGFAQSTCAGLLLEEAGSALMGVPTALTKVLQMARATLSYSRSSTEVTDRWQTPPREG